MILKEKWKLEPILQIIYMQTLLFSRYRVCNHKKDNLFSLGSTHHLCISS